MPGKDAGKVMDPKKVAEQAQHLSYPAKIALPAILAHNMNQERTLAAMNDQPAGQPPSAAARQIPGSRSRSSPPKTGSSSSP